MFKQELLQTLSITFQYNTTVLLLRHCTDNTPEMTGQRREIMQCD